MKFTLQLFAVLLLSSSIADAGGKWKKGDYEAPFLDPPVSYKAPENPPTINQGTMNPAGGGTYTGMTGFYDFQSNGGACQYIQVDPATGAVHAAYMSAPDSADPAHPARNVYYAYSTDGGTTWDTFGDVQVPGPPYRAGFASLTMGTGILASSPVIANHNAIGADPVISRIYTDSPPGIGFFSELGSPPPLGGTLEPIWPNISSTADGSTIMSASPNATVAPFVLYRAGLAPDLFTWDPWTPYPGITMPGAAAGRAPVHANGNGRVGIMYNNTNGSTGVYFLESTDNGMTWPSAPDTLYYDNRVAGVDTFAAYVQSDLVYNGDEPLFVIAEYDSRVGTPSSPGIVFMSESAGEVKAVKFDSSRYVPEINLPGGVTQRFHAFSVGWPVIGLSGTTIGVAYQAFQYDTSVVSGFNYSDVWFVQSEDNGLTWSTPVNLTNTPLLDERYPSISKWNPPGEFNITYQEDTEPGSHAFADLAPTTRASLVFNKVLVTGVDGDTQVPASFRLEQNYPNPFNPVTKISYTVSQKLPVRLTVTNILGEEVAVLVNEVREAGTYEQSFSAAGMPSGVYFYTLKAGDFVSSRKMIVLK
jgi:hypothetical protein